jgi:hypothetical protein
MRAAHWDWMAELGESTTAGRLTPGPRYIVPGRFSPTLVAPPRASAAQLQMPVFAGQVRPSQRALKLQFWKGRQRLAITEGLFHRIHLLDLVTSTAQ